MTTMENHNLKLFCWVLDWSTEPFLIKIASSDTVYELKEAILQKEHAAFENIGGAINKFSVWKVSGFSPL